jgi:protein farnesyltransferase/geranylgeranyltransferase type-1 subunit alpha
MLTHEIPLIFADISPIAQDDGPQPVCVIDYKQDFILAYDYMRAILKADERSARALELTSICLRLNPANYTVWHFRRLCLEKIGLTDERIQQDLELAAELGGSNPKNYQIAFHRRFLLEASGELDEEVARRELNYIATVLSEDGKNYHMWSSRQWIIRKVASDQMYLDEIKFSHELIAEDCRNNSAWNQRWFAVHKGTRDILPAEISHREADYAIEIAAIDPYNESPWRYLIGIIKEQKSPSMVDDYLKATTDVKQALVDADRDPEACANLNSARIDLLEMNGSNEALVMAIELCNAMSAKYDLIRRKYWDFRVTELEKKLAIVFW